MYTQRYATLRAISHGNLVLLRQTLVNHEQRLPGTVSGKIPDEHHMAARTKTLLHDKLLFIYSNIEVKKYMSKLEDTLPQYTGSVQPGCPAALPLSWSKERRPADNNDTRS